ncbi:xanthine dehydrogenase [Paramagnetospirillum kuznetsovii]|uniref:Xanthine dehydrogenase n=1 Tax=Paramagnetospirillum kuznetsovii TaxID=2053833 RepID=A0A364NVT0_9PROT|nr:XdhC family protein [Paramagnetospirillum kuznetsovii]RAU21188.1 xanthine dehydrogenase [Paramagnetospirillum kuznetsovii]
MCVDAIRCDPADMAADDGEVLETALRWMEAGKPVRLAVVLETWGSAPRSRGSYMAVAGDGAFAGSVSGGCVEAAVISEARELEAGEAPRILSFGVEDETAWHVGLPCGGNIRVAVFIPEKALLERITACHAQRIPTALALDLTNGAQSLAEGDAAMDALPKDEEDRFIRVHEAPWTMIIAGAVHISQVLAGMARAAGFAVTVLDPRTAFAQSERFPGVSLVCGEPDEVLAEMTLDRRTALVSLTHVPRLDDAALKMALASEAFYVGALGSTRTHAKRRQRLGSAGIDDEVLDRICAPVGLDIGAKTPAEIAVSILAEIIAARRGKPFGRATRN